MLRGTQFQCDNCQIFLFVLLFFTESVPVRSHPLALDSIVERQKEKLQKKRVLELAQAANCFCHLCILCVLCAVLNVIRKYMRSDCFQCVFFIRPVKIHFVWWNHSIPCWLAVFLLDKKREICSTQSKYATNNTHKHTHIDLNWKRNNILDKFNL